MRRIVFVSLVALALLVVGCGEDGDGEQYEGQYEGSEPTNPATVGTAFSEEECLQQASESGELEVDISEPSQVPSYEVVEENEVEIGKEFEVVTEAESQEDLTKVAEKLRYENRESDAISVDFYNESDGERQDAGLALVFNTRDAACSAFQYPVEEQDEISSQSNGITVLSVEEGV